MLRRALQYSTITGLRLSLHEEELSLTAGAQMHEGAVSAELGLHGYPGHRRERDGRPRPPDRPLRGRTAAPLPHLGRRVGGRDPARPRAGRRGQRRGVAAPPVPHRRAGARARPGRQQDEPAAALGGRPGGPDRGAGRRHHRLHRHRPRAPPHAREGAAVRGRAQRRDRPRDRLRGRLHRAGGARAGAAVDRDRADVGRPGAGVRAAAAGAAQPASRPTWRSGTWRETWLVAPPYASRSRNCAFAGRTLQGRCTLTIAGGSVAHRMVEVAR